MMDPHKDPHVQITCLTSVFSGRIFSRTCPKLSSAVQCKKSPFLQMHGGKWVWGSMQEIVSSTYRWRLKSGWTESVLCG